MYHWLKTSGYYISEVNPRFGGGYPHAYESGCDYMKLIAENLSGRVNKSVIGQYEEGIVMMKYNEIKLLRGGYHRSEVIYSLQADKDWREA